MPKRSVLISVEPARGLTHEISQDLHPQVDYLALQDALDASLIVTPKTWTKSGSALGKGWRLFRTAWAGFARRNDYNLIVTDLEHVGLLLALMFKLARVRRRHVMICHGKVARRGMLTFSRLFNLHDRVDRYVCYSPAVALQLRTALGLDESRVVSVLHPADHRFWRPAPSQIENLAVAAGRNQRDYETLLKAVSGLDLKLRIAAFSPWTHGGAERFDSMPANVEVGRSSYSGMRELYGKAVAVAIPLKPGNSSSGSLVMYEAMAMGKPILITRTPGIESLGVIEHGVNGYFVEPFDVEDWRQRLQELLDDREKAAAMGRAARASVDTRLNMTAFTQEISRLVREVEEGLPTTSGAFQQIET